MQGTKDLKLVYSGAVDEGEPFMTYTDADHGGELGTGKSTGGFLVSMGGGAVSWRSKLQPVVTLSTTEAEYAAAVEAGKEIKWMRNMLAEFGYPCDAPSTLLIDNQSAISVAKNPDHHGRMNWLRDEVEDGFITPLYVPTGDNAADLLTKPLERVKTELFRSMFRLDCDVFD